MAIPKTMRAAILVEQRKPLVIADVELPSTLDVGQVLVKVHYSGTFPDGREFDSAYQRNEPTEFPLNKVIPCWTEGVQLMKTGGKVKLTCPASIAYGERGAGGVIPPNATLLFEVELLAINGK